MQTKEVGGRPDSRLPLCHLAVVKDEDIPRFKRLGVIASFTPHSHGFNRDLYLDDIGETKRHDVACAASFRRRVYSNFSQRFIYARSAR